MFPCAGTPLALPYQEFTKGPPALSPGRFREARNIRQGQYSPRKRKDTAPKVNPQLAIELFFQEMGRIEAYFRISTQPFSEPCKISSESERRNTPLREAAVWSLPLWGRGGVTYPYRNLCFW